LKVWEIVLLIGLIGPFALKAFGGWMLIDAGTQFWYRRELRRHGIDPGPLPRRFRGWR
jgi:hypothetical protein